MPKHEPLQFPGWLDMLTLWMEKHFSDKVCVVFHEPLNHQSLIRKYFKGEDAIATINAEYAVLVCRNRKQANALCSKVSPDECYASG